MKVNEQHQKRLLVVGMILLMILAGVISCSSATPVPTAVQPATEVNVQLAWIHTIEYAGFYMAEEKGYYAAENLTVKLNELGDTPPIEQVISGKADFGITSADSLLLARADGVPVVAIAAIYQRSPVAFISLAENNITQPQDLIDKTVVVDFNGTTGIVYWAMLASQGIDRAQVNSVPRTDFSNEPLLNGQADVLDAFITNQPVQLARQDHPVNAILASDYGIEMYANVIFTTEDTVTNRPELVERFLRATVRGMQSAVDDPKGAAALAVAHNPDLDLEAETESMGLSLPLLNPAGSHPGMMEAEAWEAAHQILLEQDILKEALDVKGSYTLTFLEKIYKDGL